MLKNILLFFIFTEEHVKIHPLFYHFTEQHMEKTPLILAFHRPVEVTRYTPYLLEIWNTDAYPMLTVLPGPGFTLIPH